MILFNAFFNYLSYSSKCYPLHLVQFNILYCVNIWVTAHYWLGIVLLAYFSYLSQVIQTRELEPGSSCAVDLVFVIYKKELLFGWWNHFTRKAVQN